MLAELTLEHGDARVVLGPAYIHRSSGEPGRDAGTGWSANVEIRIGTATVTGASGALPADIWEGDLASGGHHHGNVLPVPLVADSAVELSITLNQGGVVRVTGKTVAIAVVGPYEFIEGVPAG